jgi:CRP-like cAMP-binding protein
VEAAADSTLLRIPDAVLRDKLASDPGFASRFYRALCVFLADRMRHTTQRMGYGAATDDVHAKDELNDDLLDNVHLAGARFDRMLKRLAG